MTTEIQTDEQKEEELPGEQTGEKRVGFSFPYYSALMILSLGVVYAFQVYFDAKSVVNGFDERSVGIAGLVKSEFLGGDYWRILTSEVVHGNIIHLLINAYAFFMLGRLFETLSNRAHLAIVFIVSAIGAGTTSMYFSTGEGASVGASGGIAGFLGYLAVYGYLRRKLLSNEFLKSMLFNIGFMIVIGFSLNAAPAGSLPRIDNFGHIGGLLAGALYGAIQIPGDVYQDPREVSKVTEVVGLAALGTFISVSLFTISLLLSWNR